MGAALSLAGDPKPTLCSRYGRGGRIECPAHAAGEAERAVHRQVPVGFSGSGLVATGEESGADSSSTGRYSGTENGS